jgi:hypothetical protein
VSSCQSLQAEFPFFVRPDVGRAFGLLLRSADASVSSTARRRPSLARNHRASCFRHVSTRPSSVLRPRDAYDSTCLAGCQPTRSVARRVSYLRRSWNVLLWRGASLPMCRKIRGFQPRRCQHANSLRMPIALRAPVFQMITSAFSLGSVESDAQRSGSAALHTEGRRFKSCIAHQRFLFPVCVRRLILLVYQRRASASPSPCGYSSDSLSWPVASLVLSPPQLRPGVSGRPRRRPTRLLPEEERHVTQWSKPGGIVRAAGRSIVDAQRGEHDE